MIVMPLADAFFAMVDRKTQISKDQDIVHAHDCDQSDSIVKELLVLVGGGTGK